MARTHPARSVGAAVISVVLAAACTGGSGDPTSSDPTDRTAPSAGEERIATTPESTPDDGAAEAGADTGGGADDRARIEPRGSGDGDLVDVYRQGIASGVWSDREEAVIAILAALAGRSDELDLTGRSTTGASGFLAVAGELLDDGTSRRPERLAALVEELSPSPARLSALVTSTASVRSEAGGIGTIRRVGVLVGCDDTNGPGSGPLDVCLLEVRVEIGSTILTIALPAVLARTDRDVVGDVVDDLADTTATVLAALPLEPGRALPPEIVVLVDPRSHLASTTSQRRVDDVCHITMAVGDDVVASASALERRLAGEIFRCYQTWNFDTSGYPANAAWIDGTASWFEHRVFGLERSDDFDAVERGRSLIDLSHENDVFFIDYEQHGTVSIDGFMALMRSGERSVQVDAWGAVPGIADDFHAFAERYLNGTIRWTGVDDDADDDIVLRSGTAAWALGPPEPFRIHRARIELVDDAGYDQRIDADADTTVSYQSPDFSAWRSPPTEVVACPDTDAARLLYTTVRTGVRAVVVAVDGVRELEPDCTPATTEPPAG